MTLIIILSSLPFLFVFSFVVSFDSSQCSDSFCRSEKLFHMVVLIIDTRWALSLIYYLLKKKMLNIIHMSLIILHTGAMCIMKALQSAKSPKDIKVDKWRQFPDKNLKKQWRKELGFVIEFWINFIQSRTLTV